MTPLETKQPRILPGRRHWLFGLAVSLWGHATLGAVLVMAGAEPSGRRPSAWPTAGGDLLWVALEAPTTTRSEGREPPRSVQTPRSLELEAVVSPPPTPSSEAAEASDPTRPASSLAPERAAGRAIDRAETEPAPVFRMAKGAPGFEKPAVDRSSGPPTTSGGDVGSASGGRKKGLPDLAASPDWPGPGLVDRPARPRWPIRPAYPAAARRRGDESTVLVEAWIDDVGTVAASAILSSGGELLDRSALDAVGRAAFRPASLGGEPVPSRVALRIHFTLR